MNEMKLVSGELVSGELGWPRCDSRCRGLEAVFALGVGGARWHLVALAGPIESLGPICFSLL
jgi:hypothetical protein